MAFHDMGKSGYSKMKIKMTFDMKPEKEKAISFLETLISQKRVKVLTNCAGQEEIYKLKFNEAIKFKDKLPVNSILAQEAVLTGVAECDLVSKVIDANTKANQFLSNTELFRMKAMILIKNAKSPNDLALLIETNFETND